LAACDNLGEKIMDIKDLKGIKSLVHLMGDSDLTEITIEDSGVKLTLKRDRAEVVHAPQYHQVTLPPAPAHSAPQPVAHVAPAAPAAPTEDASLHYVTAPLVGTFYASSSPDSPVYAKVGDRVTKGQILCIIEAMKLMNEIESDVDGVVTRVLIENASPVDYGARLFAIKSN